MIPKCELTQQARADHQLKMALCRSIAAGNRSTYSTGCYTCCVSPILRRTLSVYKGKAFMRFARKAGIADAVLLDAVQRADDGLIDADLGSGVIKQRLARVGEGKSKGSRSIILFRQNLRAVYVYGFEKKDVANIDRRELEAFRELAGIILNYSDEEMEQRVKDGALFRVEASGGKQ